MHEPQYKVKNLNNEFGIKLEGVLVKNSEFSQNYRKICMKGGDLWQC
jgi:hypothetical protein